ncbi:hypothetical protein [Yinghuangia seranimata]|uniref:hypothetical protein n=1 Tax=Yinghuangia seranimata TaxID=408067 RepID=UPI00248A976A|nr:hypothetical protein [Yinghuangia seranimata]MDI2131844.1 hypothetical protein [Yinghuangia seranimata]
MRDALRSYLQIATGLTEMTVQRVTEAAKQLVEKAGVDLDHVPGQVAQQAQAVPQYVQQVADDLFTTGKANRDLLVGVVRSEVDKAMGRLRPWVDDVRRVDDDLERVERRVTDLEHRLAQASAPARPARAPRVQAVPVEDDEAVPVRKSGARGGASDAGVRAGSAPEADAPVAKRAVTPAKAAKRAAAKKAPAKKTAAPGSGTQDTAKKTAAPGSGTRATAKKAPARRPQPKPDAEPKPDADA